MYGVIVVFVVEYIGEWMVNLRESMGIAEASYRVYGSTIVLSWGRKDPELEAEKPYKLGKIECVRSL